MLWAPAQKHHYLQPRTPETQPRCLERRHRFPGCAAHSLHLSAPLHQLQQREQCSCQHERSHPLSKKSEHSLQHPESEGQEIATALVCSTSPTPANGSAHSSRVAPPDSRLTFCSFPKPEVPLLPEEPSYSTSGPTDPGGQALAQNHQRGALIPSRSCGSRSFVQKSLDHQTDWLVSFDFEP